MRPFRLLVALALLCLPPAQVWAQRAPAVAAAASLNPAVEEVAAQFAHDRGAQVQVVFGASGTLSSTATRTDISYSYYNVGKISARGANSWCHDPSTKPSLHGSSPLLKSDLGIADYLQGAVAGAALLHSSAPAKGGAGKTAKLDVYSYEIKFVVVTSGGITPTWKLVNVSANTGNLPLINAGRTRTHDLTLTFGPGTDAPADFALQTHFTGQVVQSNRQLRRSMQ